MPQIINPFRPATSPLAQALVDVGNQIYGDQLTPALKREQLLAAQRENTELGNLAQSIAAPGGTPNYQAAVLAGYKPADLGEMLLVQNANTFGARDPRTQNAQVGAGQNYNSTAQAFDTNVATDRRGQDIMSSDRRYGVNVADATERFKFANTPEEAMVNGAPVFVPRAGLTAEGVQPILSDSERGPADKFNQFYDLYLGLRPGDTQGAENYALSQISKSKGLSVTTPDGTTVEMGGIGEPTNNVRSALQKQELESQKFTELTDLANKFLEGADADPTRFGAVGNIRRYGQNAVEVLNNVGLAVGKQNYGEELAAAQSKAAQDARVSALLPELFDPGLDSVNTIWGLMVYQGASALAGQEGRSVSDKDVQFFRQILGDPSSFFESARTMKARLDTANQIVGRMQNVNRRALGAGEPAATGLPDVTTMSDEQLKAIINGEQ